MTRSSALLVENFLEMMTTERGAALNTIESYRRDLEGFISFLTPHHKNLIGAQVTDLQQYMAFLNQNNMEASSMARAVSTFRQFYKFLILEDIRTDNPCAYLDSPKTKRPLPRVLSEENIIKLLETVHEDTSKEGIRMAALLEILYATGLRVTELVSLPFTAIPQSAQPENFYLIVRGKGNKERMVPLNRHAVAAIEKYLPLRTDFMASSLKGSKWLFPSRSAEGYLTRQRFAQLLKEFALKANLPPAAISPHVVRHAFASHLLHHGADLISVQKMLGHANIATTQIYTHILKDKLYSMVQDHHPLSAQYQKKNL